MNSYGGFKVLIAQDRMRADIVVPIDPDWGPPEMSIILEALKEEGVTFGIDEEEISRCLAEAVADQRREIKIKAATGRSARAGTNAKILVTFPVDLDASEPEGSEERAIHENEAKGGLASRRLVIGGDILAELVESTSPEAGRTVTDQIILPPESRGADEMLVAGQGTILTDDGTVCRVADRVAGYPRYSGGSFHVEDLITISGDRMAASLLIHPSSLPDERLNMEFIERRLGEMGVTHGIDGTAIRRAFCAAGDDTAPIRTVIARGKPVEHGEDAKIRYFFNTEVLPGSVLSETGSIDFKERLILQRVEKGRLLAEKTPSGPGTPGFDIFGNEIEARNGEDRSPGAVGKVEISEDGFRYTAMADGIVMLSGSGEIGVFDEHTVPSDVDYSTGNLDMNGVLIIKGWIRTGFQVKASGDICVESGIEGAVVEAGMNLRVAGGIQGIDSGRVRARGDIQVRFVENARIRAGGDITTEHIVNSYVRARGRIDATGGKGRIIGGSTLAEGGLTTKELGSRGGTKTLVIVGIGPKTLRYIEHFEKSIQSLKRSSNKFRLTRNAPVKSGRDPRTPSRRSHPEPRQGKFRREIARRELQLTKFRKRYAYSVTSKAGDSPISINVIHEIHDGTIVNVMGYPLPVKETIRARGSFRLDMDEWRVKFHKE